MPQLRIPPALVVVFFLVLIGAAADRAAGLMGGGSPAEPDASPRVEIVVTTSTATAGAPSASPTPSSTLTPEMLWGFIMPIAGACLPSNDGVMPNAPRTYRNGVHEGIDFYDGDVCVRIARGTEVVAAKDGTVIRADRVYQPVTSAEMERLLTLSAQQGYTSSEVLDRLRGRQVWIDHGGGIVTRYAHLLDVAPGVEEGVFVKAGQVIAYVGNSGTPEGIDDPDAENHLHLEIRIGDSYLGQGLPPNEVRSLAERVFKP